MGRRTILVTEAGRKRETSLENHPTCDVEKRLLSEGSDLKVSGVEVPDPKLGFRV